MTLGFAMTGDLAKLLNLSTLTQVFGKAVGRLTSAAFCVDRDRVTPTHNKPSEGTYYHSISGTLSQT